MIQLIVKILLVELTSVFRRLLVLVQKYGKKKTAVEHNYHLGTVLLVRVPSV